VPWDFFSEIRLKERLLNRRVWLSDHVHYLFVPSLGLEERSTLPPETCFEYKFVYWEKQTILVRRKIYLSEEPAVHLSSFCDFRTDRTFTATDVFALSLGWLCSYLKNCLRLFLSYFCQREMVLYVLNGITKQTKSNENSWSENESCLTKWGKLGISGKRVSFYPR